MQETQGNQLVHHFEQNFTTNSTIDVLDAKESWLSETLGPSTIEKSAQVYSSCLIVEDMHFKEVHILYTYKSHDLPLTHFMPDLVLRQETSSKSKQCAKEV